MRALLSYKTLCIDRSAQLNRRSRTAQILALQILNYKPQILDYKTRILDYKTQILDYKPQILDYEHPID